MVRLRIEFGWASIVVKNALNYAIKTVRGIEGGFYQVWLFL